MKRHFSFLLVTPLLVALLSFPAHAAIYLKLEGIEGDVQADGHENQIELSTWGWGVIGDLKGLSCPQSIDVTKLFDSSSMKLAEKAALAAFISRAEIFLTRPSGKGENLDYLVLRLEDIQIRDYEITHGGEDLPEESFTIDFRKIEVRQSKEDAKGAGSGGTSSLVHTFGLDLEVLGDCGLR